MMSDCPKCGGDDKRKDGKCRPCENARLREYRKANKTKIAETTAKYRAGHADSIRDSKAKCRRSQPEKYAAQSKRYRDKVSADPQRATLRKEKDAARNARYRQENRTIISQRITRRRRFSKSWKALFKTA